MAALPPGALPPLNNVVNLPAQPGNPPSIEDVMAACTYCREITIAHSLGHATGQVLTDAVVYRSNIVQAKAAAGGHAAAVPAWFYPAMEQALQPLNNSISRLSDGIDLLSDRVDVLSDRAGVLSGAINSYVGSVSQAARRSAIAYNRQASSGLSDGTPRQFQIVPFANGSNPTSAPHNLPALINYESVRNLSAQQSRNYYHGYYPNEPAHPIPPPARQKPLILRAIGYQPIL